MDFFMLIFADLVTFGIIMLFWHFYAFFMLFWLIFEGFQSKMPKIKSKSAWLRDWINRIDGNSVYTTDGKVIFCQVCGQQATKFSSDDENTTIFSNKQAPSDKLHNLKQHNESDKHKGNLQRHEAKEQRQKQPFLATANRKIPDQFSYDLCHALLAANIPFWKLKNETFRNFLDKYCGNFDGEWSKRRPGTKHFGLIEVCTDDILWCWENILSVQEYFGRQQNSSDSRTSRNVPDLQLLPRIKL